MHCSDRRMSLQFKLLLVTYGREVIIHSLHVSSVNVNRAMSKYFVWLSKYNLK
jgi:hypothetical protein